MFLALVAGKPFAEFIVLAVEGIAEFIDERLLDGFVGVSGRVVLP